jgi:hypothetical protein
MEFLAISKEIPKSKVKSLGFLTNLKIRFDNRQNWYEIRGTKIEIKKYSKLINEFLNIYDTEILNQWNEKDNYQSSVYTEIVK